MISKQLQRARDYEEKFGPRIAGELPRFHVTGAVGWINDPNGFAPYKGEYHLFYQYHPYDTQWGPMHWGHVKTRDFVRWERLPAALAPDTEYDRDGCFSGSAVELPDGRHLLMYTGVRNVRRRNGRVDGYQTQCVAIGDGVNYEKYPGNPVIRGEDVPQGGSVLDFRDPKIWREDGCYYAVAANRASDGSGCVLLYRSQDALHWEYVSKVASSDNQYGTMWECPDLFPLDGKHVLLTNPMQMPPQGLQFHPGNANMAVIGSFDLSSGKLQWENLQAIDYGLDFYAPQTLQTPDGRRVMIGWMQNWDTVGARPQNMHFFGQMTIPRELFLRNGRLCQLPVRELEHYRTGKAVYRGVKVCGETTLPGIHGRYLDMTLTLRPETPDAVYRWFRMDLAMDGEHCTSIRFKPSAGTLRVDRSRSGLNCDIVHVRDVPVGGADGVLKLRLILDRCSLELFVNDGAQAAACTFYTPLEADAIRFRSDGAVVLDVEKYDLTIEAP